MKGGLGRNIFQMPPTGGSDPIDWVSDPLDQALCVIEKSKKILLFRRPSFLPSPLQLSGATLGIAYLDRHRHAPRHHQRVRRAAHDIVPGRRGIVRSSKALNVR